MGQVIRDARDARDAINYLAGRGDVVEFSFFATPKGIQGNRRFASSAGYAVVMGSTATKAANDLAMGAMLSWPYPEGPLTARDLAAPAGAEMDLEELVNGRPAKELDDVGFDALMASGRIATLRFNKCSNGRWEMAVKYVDGTGPHHFSAPGTQPSLTVAALLEYEAKYFGHLKVAEAFRKAVESPDADLDDLI